jgi:hypothetical protein
MKRLTLLVIGLSMVALFLCACSSDEGPVSPKVMASENDRFSGVSGYCMNEDGSVNGVTCKVCNPLTGLPMPNFLSGVSYTHPVYGGGYYECPLSPEMAPPPDGTWVVVKGSNPDTATWGSSAAFQWYSPSVTNVIVNEY